MARLFYECRDLERPAGGVRRLYRHVEILSQHGYCASILHHSPGFAVKWFTSNVPVTYVSSGLELGPDDILVIPEGHTEIMASTAFFPCRRVAIALNWANIYSALPSGLDWRHLGISEVIAGSEYERDFVKRSMGLDSTVIVSGIDSELFKPAAAKLCQVAFMPRKNAHVFHLIASVFRSRFPEYWDVEFVPIDRLTHEAVARVLGASACFLATSFPEGLARPPLEAMACGCLVVGFAGRGALEYMHHLENCYLADDMDVLGAAELLGAAITCFREGAASGMQAAARETATGYSLEREERAVIEYWDRFVGRPSGAEQSQAWHRQERPSPSQEPCETVLNQDERNAEVRTYRDIPGHFSFDDVYDRAVTTAPDMGIFIEVGTWFGASTAYLATKIRESTKDIHIFAVDNFTAVGSGPALMAEVASMGGSFFHVFCENMRRCGIEKYVTPILGDSTSAADRFPDHSVDFVYIDACHGYDKVRADILAWLPKVKPGGIVAGHDYDESHPGVVRAVSELFPAGALEIMHHSWLVEDPCSHLERGVGSSPYDLGECITTEAPLGRKDYRG